MMTIQYRAASIKEQSKGRERGKVKRYKKSQEVAAAQLPPVTLRSIIDPNEQPTKNSLGQNPFKRVLDSHSRHLRNREERYCNSPRNSILRSKACDLSKGRMGKIVPQAEASNPHPAPQSVEWR